MLRLHAAMAQVAICYWSHLGVQVVVDVGGPDRGEEEQQLVGKKVHGHIEQGPGVWQRLHQREVGWGVCGGGWDRATAS